MSEIKEDGSQIPKTQEDFVRASPPGEPLSAFLTMLSYAQGIFPWLRSQDGQGLWWSPEPRSVLLPSELHVSHSLRKTLRSKRYTVTADTAFSEVVHQCRHIRNMSWIDDDFERVFGDLHQLGHAHSIETWQDGRLVGGLYLLAIGRMLYGSSMFHTKEDASKVALVRLIEFMGVHRFPLLDCQIQNPHLKRMGARLVPRKHFHFLVERITRMQSLVGPWTQFFPP